MTWQLFAVLQIALFAAAAITALWLRNRRLQRRTADLLTLCASAHEELTNVTGKLAAMEGTAPPEKMLAQRVKALVGDDPLVRVRRLVLENEIKPKPDFADRLREHLVGEAPPDEEEFARRWRAIRQECQQLAMFLIADNPRCQEPIEQLFDVVRPLDEAYDLELAPLDLHQGEPGSRDGGTDPAPGPSADSEEPAPPAAPQPDEQHSADPATAATETPGVDPGPADAASADEPLDQAALDALLEENRKSAGAC